MQLVFSIIFLLLALISWVAVVAYFPLGVPLGLIFLCFSLWLFAGWRYKKPIPLSLGKGLLLLPLLGFFVLIPGDGSFGLAHLFFAGNLPPGQVPWWGILMGAFDAFVLPLLWLGALLGVIVHFFRQARKAID